ncbi:hypothetical protein BDB00DRAFT_24203 [Zychaea mexicana]|uniref:uncharacterized protein n=1 Tax=Zychaea mexicana TaxID=64656 RepID=UPI0022FF38E9|nr:uncharacterized protein BDB00DRAFT_24203 [Zychaea mexicana]KAI9497317.1 hypothetical protein BDB00DRAFT_24203 [Zychaea mexicana]
MVQTPAPFTDILTFLHSVPVELQKKPEPSNQVILESFLFAAHCDLGIYIIEPILANDVHLKHQLWQHRNGELVNKALESGYKQILKDIVRLVNHANQRHEQFTTANYTYNEVQRQTHIDYLKEETAKLRRLLNALFLQNVPSTPALTISMFEPIMSVDAYDFWKLLGKDVVVPWDKFSTTYNILFGNVEPQYKKYIQNFLCESSSNNVTAFTFISLVDSFGFPFGRNNDKQALSEKGRVQVTQMIVELMRELGSPEMRAHLLEVYEWYKGIDRTDAGAIQQRANEWAAIIKKHPRTDTSTPKSEEQKRADDIDLARRAISLFYQRYMVLWKIGPTARDVIKNVDTPGKARIRDFLTYVKPLDYANLITVIGADPASWPKKKPVVYSFLDTLVNPPSK